jgi:hypothetical protein
MKKRTKVTLRFVVGAVTAAALFLAIGLLFRDKSSRVFDKFCVAVKNGDYDEAQRCCAPGILERSDSGEWMVRMINGAMPAKRFGDAEVTRIKRSWNRDIVTFRSKSVAGDAHVVGGIITYVKCP